ncbi:ABC transporter ATP-binding protein [Kitasatospora sp. NBC_01287]|uniref:ABC transporter ATP-binding protein n=1 Tax=Kitasatospora sp. NBC_01287 TaxID=2903573 RepID=UPI00225B366C|nr:ABC transporter ATP-binding protein [Kitasatospora sp. NBC_01287]MCX4745730.1 ABC transporter ATP-binding protein [Kitasatospora sp. NBC_01287]
MRKVGEPDGVVVEADGLRVVRGGRTVLVDVGFSVPACSVTGLLGPSGCGKSTLLRSVVGIQAGLGGRLEVLGLPAGSAALRGRIGYASQAPSVYPDVSVRSNLRYFATALGVPRARRTMEVDRVIAAVDLVACQRRLVRRLSGGQRARVSLAVALLGSPPLLVLDEPTVGLDPVLRREMWELFASFAAQGVTMLVSSHVMDEADRCDRLLLLREGRVLAHGPRDELLARTGTDRAESAFLALVEQRCPAPLLAARDR